MRLKVTSLFMAVRPHPHVLKHQASTAAQDLELAVALSKVATNAAPHPESCTMNLMCTWKRATVIVRGDTQPLELSTLHKDGACVFLGSCVRSEH